MKQRALLVVAVVPALLLGFPARLPAELPPYVYIDDAKRAPEALRIRVVSVKTRTKGETTVVDVIGEVTDVRRTTSALTPGSRITIVYAKARHRPGWVGPAETPLLEKGMDVPAFIEPSPGESGRYRLAARGHSFSEWLWEKVVLTEREPGAPLPVQLRIRSHACGAAPVSSVEMGRVVQQWLGDEELQVTSWVSVASRIEILEEGATAALDGKELRLTVRLRDEKPDGRPIAACIFPVHLTFRVHGLPKGDYDVILDAARAP